MITICLFARLRELSRQDQLTLSVNGPLKLNELMTEISTLCPPLASLVDAKSILVAVNQVLATDQTVIRDGDEVALMPPFSGGDSLEENSPVSPVGYASTPWTRIQREDFSIEDEITRIKAVSGRVGGVASFLGSARDFSKGREIRQLIYEHYEGMAQSKMAEIREEALRKFDILEASMIHRTGDIPLGGNIVLIVVGAEHRAEAFQACRWCIDELKARVPIWKKEVTSDGEIWLENCP